LLVFALVEAGALVWWVHLARGASFNIDEWIFLSARGLGAHSLLARTTDIG